MIMPTTYSASAVAWRRLAVTAGMLGLTWLGIPTLAAMAQPAPFAGAQRATRTELIAQASTLEQQLAGGSLKGEKQNRAKAELAGIQRRLSQGDFKVGDRFVLTFRQDSVRIDTASVRDSLRVSLLALPDLSLAGVLRSELDARLSAHVSRYLKNATIRSSVLTRIAILGAVRAPGYYYAAPDRPISDLVMLASGPVERANLAELEVSRGATVILKSKDSKRAMKDGRTLEQLDIQSGDEIRIPMQRGRPSFQTIVQLLFVFSSLFFAFLQFVQWYYSRQEG
jgi:hypothetical protein